MTKVNLIYNPFLSEVYLEINGEKTNMSEVWGDKNIRELGIWASTFYDELDSKYNDSKYEINFKGIIRDYEFLEDALKAHKNSSLFSLTGKENCVYAKDQLEKLKTIFAEIQETSPYEELKSDKLKNQFKDATSNDFEIAVVATMSSGKSTLINAMLGRELLPSAQLATTATIAKIYDEDGMTNFTAEVKSVRGDTIQTFNDFTLTHMTAVNTAGNIKKYDGDCPEDRPSIVEIHGDIIGIDSSNMRLVLSDTPGPNNSETEEHSEHTYRLLHNEYKPMILYVLNPEYVTTNDNDELLESVAKVMETGGRQTNERFIFVLNKADRADEELDKIIETTKDLLTKKKIYEPRIFPLYASLAKDIRKFIAEDKLTDEEKDHMVYESSKIINMECKHFEKYASLSNHCKKQQDEMLETARTKGRKVTRVGKEVNLEEALIHTGIISIELAINEYISKYALPKKVYKGVDSFKNTLYNKQFEANELKNLEGNEKEIKNHIKQLETIMNTLENGGKAEKMKEEILTLSMQNEIQTSLDRLSNDFYKSIKVKLDTINGNVLLKEAERIINDFSKILSTKSAELKAEINNLLEQGIKEQADGYVSKYQDFVIDLVGNVNFKNNFASAILGDLSEISTSAIISNYKYESREVVGSHYESQSKWYKPWSWFRNDKLVDEYGNVDRVNLVTIKNDEIMPKIRDFVIGNQRTALDEAKKREDDFKKFFIEEFDKLSLKIKDKASEKRNIASKKEEFEYELEKNKKNLAWLKDIKEKLEKVLSLEK